MKMVFRTLIVLVALAGLTETASAAGGIQFFYSNGSPGYRSSYHNSITLDYNSEPTSDEPFIVTGIAIQQPVTNRGPCTIR